MQKEFKLARDSERLKQELSARYDYNLDHIFKDVDDWNYKYIDSATLKRYLIKTGVHPNDGLIIAIIRRFDLDADAKLNQKEFIEGVRTNIEFSKRAIKEKDNIVGGNRPYTSQTSSKKKAYRMSNSKGNKEFRSSHKENYASLSSSRNVMSSGKKIRSSSKKVRQANTASNGFQ